jgi:division protein CdvB (Snf7/Vps24/ESCRT-III family)
MVKNFIQNWTEKEKEPSLSSKIKSVAKPTVSLKDQITEVTKRLDMQTRTLDNAVSRFQNRDAEVFSRVVKAMAQHDTARANILATELSEIRKVEKMLSHASLGLQSISMRLSTVSEMGDLVAILSPAKGMLNSVRSEMCTIFPEASQELGSIGSLLSDICTTTNQGVDMPEAGASVNNAEAMQILQEAEVAAELKLKDQLPEIADERPLQRRTSVEAFS